MYAFQIKYSYREQVGSKLSAQEYQDKITIFTDGDALHALIEALNKIKPPIEWEDEDGTKHESFREEIFIFDVELLAETNE